MCLGALSADWCKCILKTILLVLLMGVIRWLRSLRRTFRDTHSACAVPSQVMSAWARPSCSTELLTIRGSLIAWIPSFPRRFSPRSRTCRTFSTGCKTGNLRSCWLAFISAHSSSNWNQKQFLNLKVCHSKWAERLWPTTELCFRLSVLRSVCSECRKPEKF